VAWLVNRGEAATSEKARRTMGRCLRLNGDLLEQAIWVVVVEEEEACAQCCDGESTQIHSSTRRYGAWFLQGRDAQVDLGLW
jgi:hypothetical protein